MTTSGTTLSVCVLARSSRGGLERLLGEAASFADEIVVGVDASSVDDTLAIATRRADVVFRFEHVGPPVRARRMILEHATSEWVLTLDEDEGLDAAFAPLLPELLNQSRYSHFRFPRKWIVEADPLRHVDAAPWFPDWQLRLFRRDLRRIWHPAIVHSGYRVMGAGCFEDRTSILHYEPLVLTPEERAAKIDYYRQHGSEGRSERNYGTIAGQPCRHVVPGPATAVRHPRSQPARVLPEVVAVPPVPTSMPWGAALDVRMAGEAGAGRQISVEVLAANTGALAWEAMSVWPQLHLSCHIRTADGENVQWNGPRVTLPRVVEPGDSTRMLFAFRAPDEPGDYEIEWDLVSEGECWFADCGSATSMTRLRVSPQ